MRSLRIATTITIIALLVVSFSAYLRSAPTSIAMLRVGKSGSALQALVLGPVQPVQTVQTVGRAEPVDPAKKYVQRLALLLGEQQTALDRLGNLTSQLHAHSSLWTDSKWRANIQQAAQSLAGSAALYAQLTPPEDLRYVQQEAARFAKANATVAGATLKALDSNDRRALGNVPTSLATSLQHLAVLRGFVVSQQLARAQLPQ